MDRLYAMSQLAGSVIGTMSDETTFTSDLLVGLTPEQREAQRALADQIVAELVAEDADARAARGA